ncbi:hypothetical protein [Mesorhizobium sp.]|uniref:hypothetical protein n=1 Tax=Mesorhizobium sp. TaxID=1871066 RepID=UPI0025CC2CA9|nr:hypothetical protein [Mesorhizobium sp.]
MDRHAGVEKHRLFLCLCEQRFQLLAPRRDPGEIVLDLGSRHTVLDSLDQVVTRFDELCEFALRRAERSILFAPQLVQMTRVLAAEFFQQRRVH